ncbi:pyruvate dehydrogenase (acetyl-transferring) E1 component subunit alpha [Patescibacteria group bacterium]|nr:pyruvate dehydrogenase (acetyl-transferring) E1 component subunit alpha [Patescibacteria group bacterium]
MFQKKKRMDMIQFLDPEGNVVNSTGFPKLSDQDVKKIYELMVLSRVFDDIGLKLQREGRMLTYASLLGQEASQVGSASALEKEDWFITSYRDHGVWISRGFPISMLYQYWAGDERGMKIPDNINALPITIPVGSQIPHAVGIAFANKLQRKKSVAVVYFGDGATSKGDFHEGMNFAGVFKVPCVFICQNNQWAISLPRSRQTASETIAQKAAAYGFEGVLVDGNDVFAVYKATKDALNKARAGKGPTLIECYTYRLESHTTADDWKKYRSSKEVEGWQKKDPLERLKKYMRKKGLFKNEYEKKVLEDAKTKIKTATQRFESITPAKPKDMFKYLYETTPQELNEQMKDFD